MQPGEPERPNEEDEPRIELPRTPDIPPPPDTTFTRPSFSGSGAPRPMPRGGVGQGEGRHQDRIDAGQVGRLGAGMSAGILFATSVVVGFLIGQWIDHHWLRTAIPWGTLVFSLAGVAAGFLNLFRLLSVVDPDDKKK